MDRCFFGFNDTTLLRGPALGRLRRDVFSDTFEHRARSRTTSKRTFFGDLNGPRQTRCGGNDRSAPRPSCRTSFWRKKMDLILDRVVRTHTISESSKSDTRAGPRGAHGAPRGWRCSIANTIRRHYCIEAPGCAGALWPSVGARLATWVHHAPS